MKSQKPSSSPFLKVIFILLSINICGMTFGQYYNLYYNPYYNAYNRAAQLGRTIGNMVAANKKYGRNGFRNQIKKWGECRTGTISIEHGAVAIYASNGYTTAGQVDDFLTSKLSSINNDRQVINDVHIAEDGNFIVVYDDGKQWYGRVPNSVSTALKSFPYGTKFLSVSFNESGTYAIASDNGFKSNNSTYQAMYDDNVDVDEYGALMSVNVYGNGAVFCYEKATKFCGSVPTPVVNAVKSYSAYPRFVKFNRHGDYLICCKNGAFTFNIPDGDAVSNAALTYFDYASERKKIIKNRAISKYDSSLSCKFLDEAQLHSVSHVASLNSSDHIVMSTFVKTGKNKGPGIEFDFFLWGGNMTTY